MHIEAVHGIVLVLKEVGGLGRRLRDSVLGATPIALVEGRKRVLPACVSGVNRGSQRRGRNVGFVGSPVVQRADLALLKE